MASIRPYKSGYRAFVRLKGVSDSKTFITKREAQAWANRRETEIVDEAVKPAIEKYTLGDALRRYQAEVTPTKEGAHWESVRIDLFLRDPVLPLNEPLVNCTTEALGRWRDYRLQSVSGSTVIREFNILSPMFETARREWQWVQVNPCKDVRRPRAPDHREVVITAPQIKAMLRGFGYSPLQPVRSLSQAIGVAFLMALRTGMRAKDVTDLTWAKVFDDHCVVRSKKKTRAVPVEYKARRLLNKMVGFDDELVFGVTARTLDARFRKVRERVGLEGFTFHDSRHTAATMLVKNTDIDILSLCKMFGWSDPKMAMIYFNPKPADIIEMLGAKR